MTFIIKASKPNEVRKQLVDYLNSIDAYKEFAAFLDMCEIQPSNQTMVYGVPANNFKVESAIGLSNMKKLVELGFIVVKPI